MLYVCCLELQGDVTTKSLCDTSESHWRAAQTYETNQTSGTKGV